jgi:ABC-type transport system involved in cytochrome bd biosynthesis fused ATPase/permease subunit
MSTQTHERGAAMFKLLLVVFLPPLYMLIRGKWIQAFVNAMSYGIALMLLLSLVGAFVAPIPWLIAVIHAGINWNEERTQRYMKQHAQMVAAATKGN